MKNIFSNKKIAKILVLTAVIIAFAHTFYMLFNGFGAQHRDLCALYNGAPKWLFYFYEYFFELFLVVLIGVFIAVVLEKYSTKLTNIYPKNQITAFIYGSIIPACSCGVIPMIETMKKNMSVKVIITFIIAAPLLNPYTIFISFSVLGWKYAVLRIISSFILSILAGLILEYILKKFEPEKLGKFYSCNSNCYVRENDIFVRTLKVIGKLMPYILIGGLLSIIFEYLNSKQYLENINFGNGFLSMILMLIIGIPIYVCNGADVIFLKPLLAYTDLSLGAAMVFSLTSSAVCISSIVMLSQFLGKKVTALLVFIIALVTLLIGVMINVFI